MNQETKEGLRNDIKKGDINFFVFSYGYLESVINTSNNILEVKQVLRELQELRR